MAHTLKMKDLDCKAWCVLRLSNTTTSEGAAAFAAPAAAMPIARVALPVGSADAFDYWVPDGLDRARAEASCSVALGPRRLAGVVIEIAEDSAVAHDRLHADR